MDSNNLYQSCLKMLNDKYNYTDLSKDVFMDIYTNIYEKAGIVIPTNDLNKTVLIEVKNFVEAKINSNNNTNHKDEDLELKIREIEASRAAIAKLNFVAQPQSIDTDIPITTKINTQPINITTYQQHSSNNKYKTFIINTTKNNFRVTPNIDIKSHSIYPCSICISNEIKNKTPYLILTINDGIKQINYTYIPTKINNSNWDIWNPIIDDYIDITLNTNNWIISIIDYLNIPIDMNEYQTIVNDVLMVNNNYTLNINKPYYFSLNDKIKVIKNDGYIVDNTINDINGNIITINKNNLNLNDFMDSKIINYKYNITITFKYHLKQQE